ncbi:MAG: hypothetical protein Q4G45_03100, partial [Actinomycetia bacterium]|nr:hypothetical protein [Actinomycetes bacterium]
APARGKRALPIGVGAVVAMTVVALVGWLVVWPVVDKGPALPVLALRRVFEHEVSGLVNHPGREPVAAPSYFTTAADDPCLVSVAEALSKGALAQQIGSADRQSESGWAVIFLSQDEATAAFTQLRASLMTCRPDGVREAEGKTRGQPVYQTFSGALFPGSAWKQATMVRYGNLVTLTMVLDQKEPAPQAAAIQQRVDELAQR